MSVTNTPLLSATNVFKSYGSLPVLKGISLSVQAGEIISIVGASGAGKSTLLHILGTLDQPDEGQVMLKDTAMERLSLKELARFRNQHIGFVFQFHNLLPEFSALENICLPAYIAGQDQREAEDRGKQLMDMLGIGARAQHKPNQLSGGEQQRTAVARALINSPEVVFADEPSGNLDSKNAEELHRLFFQLRDELGQTFVIVTHNRELAEMADRKLQITDGYLDLENHPSTSPWEH